MVAWTAEGMTSLDELVSQMADTPQDHQAAAEYFRDKAQSARAEAMGHKHMRLSYSGSKAAHAGQSLNAKQVKEHCERIAEAQASLAKEYEALAKLHEAEAKGVNPAKP
jgi:hypothetical protein